MGQYMLLHDSTKDVIGGYFLILARDYTEAEAIALDCPHAQRGKGVEIRQIHEMS
ncbi:MAG: YciI family protein [Minwuia sp.]|nr:YciI family protein [Minwuia sp.]